MRSSKRYLAILLVLSLIILSNGSPIIPAYRVTGSTSEERGEDISISSTHPSAMIANHNNATLSRLTTIPIKWITKAKDDLHIVYGHTSHGSQIVDGMSGLISFKGNVYDWKSGGNNGALDFRDTPGSFGTDLGNGLWPTITRDYLNANSSVNVVMWSWCGQVSGASVKDIENYLNSMTQLEGEYPNVSFVYMTGHTDGSGIDGTLNIRNEQIRSYCNSNNKILYDFADIESYDPSGTYYLNKAVNDECNYDSDGNGSRESNWATTWQNAHALNVDWYNCGSAHSQPINANMKAYAAWYLWARIAGWDGTSSSTPTALPTVTPTPRPTSTPTATPTVTPRPTSSPIPTAIPTAVPVPTTIPTSAPAPTTVPTVGPTITPTTTPAEPPSYPIYPTYPTNPTIPDPIPSISPVPTLIPTLSPSTSSIAVVENRIGSGNQVDTEVSFVLENGQIYASVNMEEAGILKRLEDRANKVEPINIEIPISTEQLILQLSRDEVTSIEVTINVTDNIQANDNINIDINLDFELLEVAAKGKKDIHVVVRDERGHELYSWSFDGDALAASKRNMTDINLALTVEKGMGILNQKINSLTNKYNIAEGSMGGLILGFNREGSLPAQAKIKFYVGDLIGKTSGTGLSANKKVYIYRYNIESGKLETLPYSSKYKVDKDGYITANLVDCSDYIILPEEANSSSIASLREQISVVTEKQALYSKGIEGITEQIMIELPSTLELKTSLKDRTSGSAIGAVTASFKSTDERVVIVDKNGMVTAKGAGTATIVVKIKLYSNKIRTFMIKISVKK